MSKDQVLLKLDVNAIEEAGINLDEQVSKCIRFVGLLEMKKRYNNNVLEVFKMSNFADARIRQIACEFYSIVFNLSELSEDEWLMLKELELYILLPQKIGALSTH